MCARLLWQMRQVVLIALAAPAEAVYVGGLWKPVVPLCLRVGCTVWICKLCASCVKWPKECGAGTFGLRGDMP
jgi:hypothetical protein